MLKQPKLEKKVKIFSNQVSLTDHIYIWVLLPLVKAKRINKNNILKINQIAAGIK